MRGKAVATRLQRFGSDVPVSRNERAEGLVINSIEDPVRRCMVDAPSCATASLAGSDAAKGGCLEEQLLLAAD